MLKRPAFHVFALLMLVLVPVELACAYLAYETIGEISSMLYYFAVGLNLVFIVVAIRFPRAAAVGAVLLGLAIVPYQLVLGDRLIRVQAEAAQIVGHVYEERLRTGQYPADLGAYEPLDPRMKAFIQRYERKDTVGGFLLAYRVGTETTSHTYTPDGGWSYYPD
jgi:hypothetical protein